MRLFLLLVKTSQLRKLSNLEKNIVILWGITVVLSGAVSTGVSEI